MAQKINLFGFRQKAMSANKLFCVHIHDNIFVSKSKMALDLAMHYDYTQRKKVTKTVPLRHHFEKQCLFRQKGHYLCPKGTVSQSWQLFDQTSLVISWSVWKIAYLHFFMLGKAITWTDWWMIKQCHKATILSVGLSNMKNVHVCGRGSALCNECSF